MMDPIKIEVELSASESQDIRRRRQVPVSFNLPSGLPKDDKAFVYHVDTSADPGTRTFSVTLLLINEKFRSPLPAGLGSGTVARMEDCWPLYLNRVVGAPDNMRVVEEKSIMEDESGHFVYQVTNSSFGDPIPRISGGQEATGHGKGPPIPVSWDLELSRSAFHQRIRSRHPVLDCRGVGFRRQFGRSMERHRSGARPGITVGAATGRSG